MVNQTIRIIKENLDNFSGHLTTPSSPLSEKNLQGSRYWFLQLKPSVSEQIAT